MLGDDYDDHDLIFCLPDGVSLRPKTVTDAFAGHAAACQLPVIRLHDMRHGGAHSSWPAVCRSRSSR